MELAKTLAGHIRQRKSQRSLKELDLDILKVIKTGTNWKTGIMYASNTNFAYINKELKKLIEQGYVVMVDFDIGRMKEQEEGTEAKRYSLTERARMWLLVAEREAELAPK